MRTFNHARPITPSDSVSLAYTPQAIGLSAAGTVCVDTAGGEVNQTLTLSAGITTIAVTKVYATGTSVSITAYW